jgi:hypothetical protein
VDCFASLAMTASQLVLKNVDGRDKPGHDGSDVTTLTRA